MRTFRDIAVKLRVVRFIAFTDRQTTVDFDSLDWDLRSFVLVQREVEGVADGGAL